MPKKRKGIISVDRIVPRNKNEKSQFVPLHTELTGSAAYRSLPPGARCLLQEMMSIVFPDRNGKVCMSHDRAAKLVCCTRKTASIHLSKLLERGFVKMTKGELWQQRKSREYSLTMATRSGRWPKHDYLSWKEGDNIFAGSKKFAGLNEDPEQV